MGVEMEKLSKNRVESEEPSVGAESGKGSVTGNFAQAAADESVSVHGATERDDGVTLIAVYHFLVAGLFLLSTVVLAFPTLILGIVAVSEDMGAVIGMFAVGLIGAVTMTFCVIYLCAGYGLWKMRHWARVTAIGLAVISLFWLPIGTAIGAATIWYLVKADVVERFA